MTLESKGASVHQFEEPDFCYELTAIAVAPHPSAWKFLQQFGLAGKVTHHEAAVRERNLRARKELMESCYQTSGVTMLGHGVMVRDRFRELVSTGPG